MAKRRKPTPKRKKPAAPAGGAPEMFPLVVVRPRGQARPDDTADAAKAAEERAVALAMIERLARAQLGPADIATIMEIPAEHMTGGDAQRSRAYDTGRLLAQVEVREMVLKLAQAGSGPAQKLLLELASATKAEATAGQAEGPAAGELLAVREHLAALELAPAGTSIIELARLAVARIIELESRPE